MNWFSIASILLFMFLITRVLLRMRKGTLSRRRAYLLVSIFTIHIAAIFYLNLSR